MQEAAQKRREGAHLGLSNEGERVRDASRSLYPHLSLTLPSPVAHPPPPRSRGRVLERLGMRESERELGQILLLLSAKPTSHKVQAHMGA